MAIFKPLQTTTRSQYVFDHIKNAIFKGKLKPGTPLRELQLAEEFQLSQATIREALMQLEKIGIVEKIPHKGTRVIELSEKEITDRLTVRFQLEKLSYIQAAENMTEKDYQELYKIKDEISKAVNNRSYFELIKADTKFHRFIWEKSNNQVLYDVLDQITIPLFAYLSLEHHAMEDDISQVVLSHDKFIDALKSKDQKKIRDLFHQVEKHSYQRYIPNGKDYLVPQDSD